MGLDAFVRCNCLETGKVSTPPVPLEDLFIDEEGYVDSRSLAAARKKLDRRQFDARYQDLEDKISSWQESACEHEDMEICAEWVANIAGWSMLKQIFKGMPYEDAPHLRTMLPDGNGGSFPADKAAAALCELDAFLLYISDKEPDELAWAEQKALILKRLLNASIQTGNPIVWC